MSCQDLLRSGKLMSGVYVMDGSGPEDSNEKGRSFRRRYCEQESSSGGGWTVVKSSSAGNALVPSMLIMTLLCTRRGGPCMSGL